MSREPAFIHPHFYGAVERLAAMPWFASAGKQLESNLGDWCSSVSSAERARTLLESDSWEEWSSEVHGRLTEYLDRVHHSRYQDWRQISAPAKEVLAKYEPVIASALTAVGLPGRTAVDTVRWDIVAVLVCAAFSDCTPPTDTLRLLDVYEAGHLPVGWDAESKRVLVY